MSTLMSTIRKMNESVDTIAEEAVELEEGKMKEFHAMVKKGMTAAQIAKKLGMEEKDVAEFMKGMDESVEFDINEAFEALDEAVADWTVTVAKPVNKLKKGDEKKVKARSAFEAISKAMKLWGDPSLKAAPASSFSVTKESVELEEHVRKSAENTVKGVKWDMNENRYGLTDSLIAAVNNVVTGVEAADPVEPETTNEIIENGPVDMQEGAEGGTGDKEAYQKFFQAALKKFGASSPADLDNKKKKEFYDYVDANWKGDNEVAESALKEFKADGEDSATADPIDTKAKQPKPMKGKKAKAESKDKDKDSDEDKKGGEKVEINPKLQEAAEMTDAQKKKREEIVLSMKSKIPEFKKKYGDRWEDVLNATATKLAMK